MSQAQLSPTSQPSSQPFSLTSSEEGPKRSFEVCFAAGDDAVDIHRFLMEIAVPVLRCPVDFLKSFNEVRRVVNEGAAFMLIVQDKLVGSLGVTKGTWWYGEGEFLCDRWHFVKPEFDNTKASRALLQEAIDIAHMAELDFVHYGKLRARGQAFRMRPTLYAVNGEIQDVPEMFGG